jgi:hypothetical protein
MGLHLLHICQARGSSEGSISPLRCDVTAAKGHTTPYRLFHTATGCTGRLRSGFGVSTATSDRHVGEVDKGGGKPDYLIGRCRNVGED